MAMNVGSSSGENEVMVEMNTTPLIDVMLVLLVMLIVTIPIQTHAVKLDMPQPNTHPPLIPPTIIELGVDFDGTISPSGNTRFPSVAVTTQLGAAIFFAVALFCVAR